MCDAEGCERRHVAKGLCSTHYNQTYFPDSCRREKTCEACGANYTTTRTNGRFCSLLCRDYARTGGSYVTPLHSRHPVVRELQRRAAPPSWWTGTPKSWAVYYQTCRWCGALFASPSGHAAFCSPRCGNRAARLRRRANEHHAYGSYNWPDFMRIAQRFGFSCAYCGVKPDDQLDPDHVVPLSRRGANTTANLLPACRACNSDKRDLLLDEWAEDRLVRGLPGRVTSWGVEDRRYHHLTAWRGTPSARGEPDRRGGLLVASQVDDALSVADR